MRGDPGEGGNRGEDNLNKCDLDSVSTHVGISLLLRLFVWLTGSMWCNKRDLFVLCFTSLCSTSSEGVGDPHDIGRTKRVESRIR